MTDYIDATGKHCAMIDECSTFETVTEAYSFLVDNFKRHYNSNRSPFPMFMHTDGVYKSPVLFNGMYKKRLGLVSAVQTSTLGTVYILRHLKKF